MTQQDVTLTSSSIVTISGLKSLPISFIEAVLGDPLYSEPREYNRTVLFVYTMVCQDLSHLITELAPYITYTEDEVLDAIYKEILCYLIEPSQFQVADSSYVHQYLERFTHYMNYFHRSAFYAMVEDTERDNLVATYLKLRQIIIDALCCLYDLNPNKPRKHMVIDDDKDCNATNSCE